MMQVVDLPRYEDIQWVHQITLPDGRVTPGRWPAGFEAFGLPHVDFKGKRTLDIGCLDGQYTFYAERQGASEVLSIDLYSLPEMEELYGQPFYPQQTWSCFGYLYAYRQFNSQAKYIFPYSVYDLDPSIVGQFDICLFLGVIYHLIHPAVALERINAVLKPGGTMILEAEISPANTMFCYKVRHNEENGKLDQRRQLGSLCRTAAKLLLKKTDSASPKKLAVELVPRAYYSDALYRGDVSTFWVMDRLVLERLIDFCGFRIEKAFPRFDTRISYICRKVAEVDKAYAVNGKYTSMKDRVTNFDPGSPVAAS